MQDSDDRTQGPHLPQEEKMEVPQVREGQDARAKAGLDWRDRPIPRNLGSPSLGPLRLAVAHPLRFSLTGAQSEQQMGRHSSDSMGELDENTCIIWFDRPGGCRDPWPWRNRSR